MFVCHNCLVSLTPPPHIPSPVLSKCYRLFFFTLLFSYFCHVFVHFYVVLLSFSLPFLTTWCYYFSCHPDRSSFSLLFLLFCAMLGSYFLYFCSCFFSISLFWCFYRSLYSPVVKFSRCFSKVFKLRISVTLCSYFWSF